MHVIRPNYDAINRAVRWTVLVLAVVLAMCIVLMAVVTAPARADDGGPPDQTGPDQEQAQQALEAAIANGTATGTYVGPFGNERWVGVFGTHVAAGYGYPYAAAPDCNEGSLGAGCVGDSRGFLQGQCTSWVAYRLAMRNGLSFSNWYAGRHWGNASEWGKVAKRIGYKPDKTPAIGAIGWYKRGHVSYVEDVYSGGTILISEMNTDGHNGFHFTTVSPGMSGYPDKFIHLDDVVPVDTTPPTEPTDVRAAAHRGRTGLTWRASSDAFGVAGYRVFRNGVRLATIRGTRYRDNNPPAGLTAVYQVVAFDSSGHTSSRRPRHGAARDRVRRPGLGLHLGRARAVWPHRPRQASTHRLPAARRRWLALRRAQPDDHVGRGGEPRLPAQSRRQRVLLPCRRAHRSRALVHGPRPRCSLVGSRPDLEPHAAPGLRRHLGHHADRSGALRPHRVGQPSHRDLHGAHRHRLAHRHDGGARRGARRTAAPSSPPMTARSPSAAGFPSHTAPAARAPTSTPSP